jgi:hypothetical protein
MASRTNTPEPTDRAMWARVLKALHPDQGGDPAAVAVVLACKWGGSC